MTKREKNKNKEIPNIKKWTFKEKRHKKLFWTLSKLART